MTSSQPSGSGSFAQQDFQLYWRNAAWMEILISRAMEITFFITSFDLKKYSFFLNYSLLSLSRGRKPVVLFHLIKLISEGRHGDTPYTTLPPLSEIIQNAHHPHPSPPPSGELKEINSINILLLSVCDSLQDSIHAGLLLF